MVEPAPIPDVETSSDDAPTVLAIVGSGRSGSTLIERILGSIPGVVNVGEMVEVFRHLMDNNRPCGCGRPLRECQFWSQVGEQAFGGWSTEHAAHVRSLERQVARNRDVLLPTVSTPAHRRKQAEYRRTMRSLYAAVLEVSGAQVVLDASKWPAHAGALAGSASIDLRLLHLVRDARGVAYSWSKENTGLAVHSTRATAVRWTTMQVASRRVRRMVEPNALLRYEDFAADPRRTLADVMARLDLPWDDSVFVDDTTVELTQSHGVGGNPMRRANGRLQLRADEDWRAGLPRTQRFLVSSLSAPMLSAHGYSVWGPDQ